MLEPKQKPVSEQIFNVEKRSSSKMFWNKRAIGLRDAILSYYTKQGKDLGQPKTSVHVDNVLYIGPPEKSKKANQLEVTFMAKDLIKKSANTSMMNTSYGKELMASQKPIVITQKKEVVIWELAFSSKEQVELFLSAVEKAKTQAIHEEVQLDKSHDQEHYSNILDNSILEQQRLMEEQERLKDELLKSKLQQQQEQQRNAEKERQMQLEKDQLMEQLEEQKRLEKLRNDKSFEDQQQKKQLEQRYLTAWNMKFLSAIEQTHVLEQQSIEELVTSSYLLHSCIEKFSEHAKSVASTIIQELMLPNYLKTIKCNSSDYRICDQDQIYIHEGLCIRLAECDLKTVTVSINHADRELQVYDSTAIRTLGNEYRHMSLLAEQIELQLQEDNTFPLRVPISAIVDYCGVRALVIAIPPLGAQVQGVDGNQYQSNQLVHSYLSILGRSMNLKGHRRYYDNQVIPINVALCFFLTVYQLHKEQAQQMRQFDQQQLPEQLSLYYILKCHDLMPIHEVHHIDISKRLRPELVRGSTVPVSADALIDDIEDDDDLEVRFCSKRVKDKVQEVMKKLEMLEYLPVDSNEFTQILHREGINMRMLGNFTQTEIQHLKELAICEMVARTCKKVLRNNLSDLIHNLHDQLTNRLQTDSIECSLVQELSTQDLGDVTILLQHQSKLMHETAVDFLNLILGIGKECDIFWNQIIQKQIWYDYQYHFDASQRTLISAKGLLLISILQQCDIQYPVTPHIVDSIFKVAFPISINEFKLTAQVKSYSLSTTRIAMKSKRRDTFKHLNNKEILEQTIRWAIQLEPQNKSVLLAEQAELALMHGAQDQAFKLCQIALTDEVYHVSSLKAIQVMIKIYLQKGDLESAIQYFEQALIILETHVGPSHPLYSTLYCILAYYFVEQGQLQDALQLYESSLACSLRQLRNDHPSIADIYTDMGLSVQSDTLAQQYYEKALHIYQLNNMQHSVQYARTQLQHASLLFLKCKYQQAYLSCQSAIDILEQHEYTQTDQLIDALMLQKQILTQIQDFPFLEAISTQLELLKMRHNI